MGKVELVTLYKNEPVISVVMSVYNGERYLKKSIESILTQSFTNFEFVIINDASTDKTDEIIKLYNDPRIVYIKNETNIGQTKSLNKAIKISRGKYIARMDADDIAFPDRFNIQVEFLNENPTVKVVGSWYLIINESGKVVRKVCLPADSTEIKALLIASSPLTFPYIAHPTVMIREEIFDDVGYYNEKYYVAQDYDLWIRISREYQVMNLPKVLLKYRMHKLSLTKHRSHISIKEGEEITNSNITYYMPEIGMTERHMLLNMLLFKKQTSTEEGKKVFEIFDTFYSLVMAKELERQNLTAHKYFYKLKLFYLPQLFITNKILSLKIFLYNLFINFKLVISRRFFVNIYRTIKPKMIS